MTLMDETGTAAGLDRELEELQIRVELARRNPWHGGDVVAPQYRQFLSSLAAKPSGAPDGGVRGRNVWRETMEQLA